MIWFLILAASVLWLIAIRKEQKWSLWIPLFAVEAIGFGWTLYISVFRMELTEDWLVCTWACLGFMAILCLSVLVKVLKEKE